MFLQNVAICFPKIFVLFLLKISLSGKVPTVLSFFFFFFPYTFFHSFFFLIILFFFLSQTTSLPTFIFSPPPLYSYHFFTLSPCHYQPSPPPLPSLTHLSTSSFLSSHHPLPPPYFFPFLLVFKFL